LGEAHEEFLRLRELEPKKFGNPCSIGLTDCVQREVLIKQSVL
jgi:hypothetical protein